MTEQLDLLAVGAALKRAAMAQVEQNADAEWISTAKNVVWQLIREGQPFTSDIVWARLDALGVATHEPRALGPVMLAAARAGFMTKQGYVNSTRRECHCRPIPVYVPTGKQAAA